jgi:hypothetical protein
MILPHVKDPQRLRGLYVFDFGEWAAIGYTADEIAVLLEHERYRDGKVYKIHRASPDGHMELRGVSGARFRAESAMFFYRNELELARTDYEQLGSAAEEHPGPCRAFMHLVDRSAAVGPYRFATALIFPAEFEDEIGEWLNKIGFYGGDMAEGGISHASNYYEEQPTILDRQQLWSQTAIPSRSPEEVLATVRQAVQR